MSKDRLSLVTSQLKGLFLDRIRPQEPLIINVDGEPIIHRRDPAVPLRIARLNVSLLRRLEAWEPALRLSRMLSPIFSMLNESAGGAQWRETLLIFAAADACLWTARLAEQLGAEPACNIRRDASDQTLFSAMSNARRAGELTTRTSTALIRALTAPPAECLDREKAKTLRLERHTDDSIRAVWFTPAGEVLCEAPLDDVIKTACKGLLSNFFCEIDRLHVAQRRQRAAGEEFLKAVCPEFARVMHRALHASQPMGYWMFAASDALGTDYDVHLFVEPLRDNEGAIHFCVRRAFDEFVLEDGQGRLWYFPPGQLQARVEFGASPRHCLWKLAHPEVRLPAEAPKWRHPYTGEMRPDRFRTWQVVNRRLSQAPKLPPISREVLQYLPELTKPAGVTRVNDMCLSAQDAQLGRLSRQVRDKLSRTGELDVLAAVRGILALGKQGLTRAHQQNQSTPRAGFDRMVYLLRPEVLRSSNLCGRLYHYSRK